MDIRTHSAHHPRIKQHRGVTLLELMVTLTVALILLSIAVPAMNMLIMNNRMSTQVNDLLTTIQGARSFAITHQQRTVLCPSSDHSACANSSAWQGGWIVFADRNANQQRDDDESLSRVNNTPAKTLTINSSSGRTRIVFQADGTAGGSNTTITLCDARGSDQARAIIIAMNGRPRVSRTKSDGGPLNCR